MIFLLLIKPNFVDLVAETIALGSAQTSYQLVSVCGRADKITPRFEILTHVFQESTRLANRLERVVNDKLRAHEVVLYRFFWIIFFLNE